MDLSHENDFNKPLTFKEVFRQRSKEGEVIREYSAPTSFCWEDVRGADGYFQEDDWVDHKGEKFYIILSNQAQAKLVMGSYEEFIKDWSQLRSRYPFFMSIGPLGEDDNEDY
jgi:hypothetical protein